MTRRLAREKALQALFQVDVGKIDPQYALASVLEDGSLSERDSSYA
ncbi:MAG: N utilization substance protein B, partial [Clostridia bacterium]|nr:N utilization substance protein B [Clostridia bacterium]